MKDKDVVCYEKRHGVSGFLGGGYGLAFMGVLIYYLQQSTTFWQGILAILKALVWPAFLMYKIFTLLKM